MTLDLTGKTLADLIVPALGLPVPPVDPTPDQETAYQTALAAQYQTWTTISQQILTYLVSNTSVIVPASGILDGYGSNCSGISTTGNIK